MHHTYTPSLTNCNTVFIITEAHCSLGYPKIPITLTFNTILHIIFLKACHIPLLIAGREMDLHLLSTAAFSECLTALSNNVSSFLLPPDHCGPTVWITFCFDYQNIKQETLGGK